MNDYCVNTTTCRRTILFSDYDECSDSLKSTCKCCDVCTHLCECGNCHADNIIPGALIVHSNYDVLLLPRTNCLFYPVLKHFVIHFVKQ